MSVHSDYSEIGNALDWSGKSAYRVNLDRMYELAKTVEGIREFNERLLKANETLTAEMLRQKEIADLARTYNGLMVNARNAMETEIKRQQAISAERCLTLATLCDMLELTDDRSDDALIRRVRGLRHANIMAYNAVSQHLLGREVDWKHVEAELEADAHEAASLNHDKRERLEDGKP